MSEEVSEPCDLLVTGFTHFFILVSSVNCKHKRRKRSKRRREEKEDAIAIAKMKEDSQFLEEKTQQEMAGKGDKGTIVSNGRERAEGSEAQPERREPKIRLIKCFRTCEHSPKSTEHKFIAPKSRFDTESTKSMEGRSGLSTSDQIINDIDGIEDVTLVDGNDTALYNFKVCKEGDSVANNAKDVNSNILLDMKYDATSSTQNEAALVQKELCSAKDKTSSPQKEIVPVQKNAPSSTEKEYNTRLKKNSTKSNGNTILFWMMVISVASSNFIARPTAKQSPGSSLVQTPISGFLTKANWKRFNGKVKKF
eukprot:gene9920-10936_t